MNILMHDFGGYPYPADLSRALAARGHTVTHAYCASLETTPGGAFARRDGDPDTLDFLPISLGAPLDKYSFARRWRQERAYGRLAAAATTRLRPDVVVSANMPLDAQRALLPAARGVGAGFVFWLQDVIGVAAHRLLKARIPVAGDLVGRYYMALEARLLRASDAVVPITDDFRPLLERWRVAPERVTTVENWAPLDGLPVRPKCNAWAEAHGLGEAFVFLYAGTMGMKHNPDLLVRLAESVRDRPDVRVAVVSQGLGADHLARARRERGLGNLVVLPFEPFERMPDVMGAADVLVGVLEPDAGVFSVPSKVLAYLCAGRPLLLAMPPANLAARIVAREGAGEVAAPDDADGFVRHAAALLADPARRARMGLAARRYAEAAFPIGAIADRVERVLDAARARARART